MIDTKRGRSKIHALRVELTQKINRSHTNTDFRKADVKLRGLNNHDKAHAVTVEPVEELEMIGTNTIRKTVTMTYRPHLAIKMSHGA